MSYDVSYIQGKPTHHILLKGWDNTEVPLILCNAQGEADIRGMVANPYPRTSLRTSSGENAYTDLELPYVNVVQDNFIGGRGSMDFEKDKTKFYDSNGVITWHDGQVTLAGKVTSTSGPSIPKGQFFQYKGALYFVTKPNTGTSVLYRNGYRGVATGTQGASQVTDTTQSWSASELVGATCKITGGAGFGENKEVDISSSAATYFAIDAGIGITFPITPVSGSTEYVVGNMDSWDTVTPGAFSSGERVSDVCVVGDVVYFALYDGDVIRRYREFNSGGTWTIETAQEGWAAEKLLAIPQGDGSVVMWGADNDHDYYGNVLWRAMVPAVWGADGNYGRMYSVASVLVDNKSRWIDADYEYIDEFGQTLTDDGIEFEIDADHTTGYFASKKLEESVNMTDATWVGAVIESDVALSAYDLQIEVADKQGFVEYRTAKAAYLRQADILPSAAYFWDGTSWLPQGNATKDDVVNRIQIGGMTTTDELLIGYAEPVHKVRVRAVGANTNAATMTVEVWEGSGGWKSRLNTDGTADSGNTIAQDGDILINYLTTWVPGTDISQTDGEEELDQALYWMRIKVSATLSADVKMGYMGGAASSSPTYDLSGRIVTLSDAVDGLGGTYDPVNLFSDSYLVVMSDDKFNEVDIDLGAVVNAETATIAAYYYDGEQLVAVQDLTDHTADSGATLAQDGYIDWPKWGLEDWKQQTINGVEGYAIWLLPSAELTMGVTITRISVGGGNYMTTLSLGSIPADTPRWMQSDWNFSSNKWKFLDQKNIEYVRLNLRSDRGAQNIKLHGPIYLNKEGPEYIPIDGHINGIEAYGDQRKNPWVFTDTGAPVEVQVENDYALVPIPLDELEAMQNQGNGIAHCTNDVYMYFNMGQRVMQYYNGNLVDVGPNKGVSLPISRRLLVSDMISVPGTILVSTGFKYGKTSCIFMIDKAGAVHEVYRSSSASIGIEKIYYEELPTKDYDKLWISNSSGSVKWIPYSIGNPIYCDGFEYQTGGTLETAGISANLMDVEKLMKSLKLYQEQMYGGDDGQYISVSYKMDDFNGSWTAISNDFDTIPFQEELFSTTYNKTGKRLFLKFTFTTDDDSYTPILKAWVLECLMRYSVKMSWTITFRLRDDEVDLNGEPEQSDSGGVLTAYQKYERIMDFMESPKPVYMNCVSLIEDMQYVFPEPGSLRMIKKILNDQGQETRIYQLNLLQV